jgi:hypothetical protein
MHINDDYSQRIVLSTEEMPWVAAPGGGVERRMLVGTHAPACVVESVYDQGLDISIGLCRQCARKCFRKRYPRQVTRY